MKVFVYFNIRDRNLSVKALEGEFRGRVVARAEQIMMKDVSFKVSAAGRARVLRTKRKNVHAGAVGEIEAMWGAQPRGDLDNGTIKGLSFGKPFLPLKGVQLRYNPYETSTFIEEHSGRAVTSAKRIHLDRSAMRASGVA